MRLIDLEHMEGDDRFVAAGQTFPDEMWIDRLETLGNGVDHHQHRLDGGVVPPLVGEPWLVTQPARGRLATSHRDRVDQPLAERAGAGTGGIGEVRPRPPVHEFARTARGVPVDQEQGGQALLTIEGAEHAVGGVAVDEVETDARIGHDGAGNHVQKTVADVLNGWVFSTLRVVALDERDLDARDPVIQKETGVGGDLVLHCLAPGSAGRRYGLRVERIAPR